MEGILTANFVAVNRAAAVAVSNTRFEPLYSLLAEGRAFELTCPARERRNAEPTVKASAKANLQQQLRLPICTATPLVFFIEAAEQPALSALEQYLKRNVQAIAMGQSENLATLAEQYPDRLSVILGEQETIDEIIYGVDGVVIGSDPCMTATAMASGAVPIVAEEYATRLAVDLEPTCQSGSAVIVPSRDTESISEGLGRFCSAFSLGKPFRLLQSRIVNYVPTWEVAAGHFLQLMKHPEDAS